jgi:FlaG/FlaF family flagellin (archaellin)
VVAGRDAVCTKKSNTLGDEALIDKHVSGLPASVSSTSVKPSLHPLNACEDLKYLSFSS